MGKAAKEGLSLAEKYTYRVCWSEDDAAFIAACAEFPSLAAHGDSAEAAFAEIINVVGASIRWMKEDGEPVPKPLGAKKYKGNITLRVPSELHRALVMSSAEEGVSLNQYILSKIAT